jgi:hypothetical protein
MAITFTDHSAFQMLGHYSYPHCKFFDNFEVSWDDCKNHTDRVNSACAFVDMIINNLNCTVVNYVPQHRRNKNIFTVLSVTIQKVAILDDSICDTYCMCYGSYVKYLHVFYPSKLVDSVTKKKYVF